MSKTNKNTLNTSMAYPLFVSLLLMSGAPKANALPQDGTVVGGSASISSTATDMTVSQSTNRAIINWRGFDIASGESVTFAQPTKTSITLNRVVGGSTASQIFGALSANGNIVIVNAHGVVFGAGAKVNVGGLIATSSDVGNDSFMAGDYNFTQAGDSDALISNAGEIIADGGLVAMAGPNVSNTGLIQAKLGKVQLASGDTFAIDLYGDGLIKLQASDKLTKQLVSNSGQIIADGGEIVMTAAAAQSTIDSVINMGGLLQADSVGTKDGHIVLSAEQGSTTVSGTISAQGKASGETGGTVEVLGDNVKVASSAKINASGQAGGGTVHVGGDYQGSAGTKTATTTIIEDGASLKANATDNGDGGEVIVWSDEATTFAGAIEAKGGVNGGNGGFVETSGASLDVSGFVDASAVLGTGGEWLLDPQNIKITTSSCPAIIGCVGYSITKVSSIQNTLNTGTDVTVTTSSNGIYALQAGNIEVANSITKSAGSDSTLTLKAANNVVIDNGVTISSTKNKLNVALNADTDANGSGSVDLGLNAKILSNGGYVTFSGNDITAHSRSAITTSGGAVTFNADDDITLYDSSAISSGAGAVALNAGGGIEMTDGASITSSTGVVALNAGDEIIVDNSAKITTTTGAIGLTANDGIDLTDGAALTTAGGAVTLKAGQEIDMHGSSKISSGAGAVGLTAGDEIAMKDKAQITTTTGAVTLKATDEVVISGQSSITTAGGAIAVSGHGDGSSTGGVLLSEATLNAGGGNISLVGTGYASTFVGGSYGVKIDESTIKTSGAGTISINGTGGVSGFSVAGVDNYGVFLDDSSVSTTGNGKISITGTGGNSVNVFNVSNFGVSIDDSMIASTGGSDIAITGFGGTDKSLYGVNNDGLALEDATIRTTSGTITLTGVAGVDKSLLGAKVYGINVEGYNTIGSVDVSGVPNDTGEISFITDTLKVADIGCDKCMAESGLSVATTGNVTFKTYTDDASIGVAGAAGTLQVTKTILDHVDAGSITVGDLSDGSGALTANAYSWDSAVNFLTKSGPIVINGMQTLGNHAFFAETTSGNITIGSAGGVSSTAKGTSITLAASGGNFYNYSGSDALSASKGRWLIYSTNPANDRMDGLTSSFHRYSCTFGGSCPDFSTETGNGNLYSFTPYLTVLVSNASTTYGSAATYSYYLNGYLVGDAVIDSVTGLPVYTSAYDVGSNVGTYSVSVAPGTLLSALGYGFIGSEASGTLTVNPALLTVTANDQTKVYGDSDPALTYDASGFVLGQTAANVLTGALDRDAGEHVVSGGYTINQGTLVSNPNYIISYTSGTLTITPATLLVTADSFSKVYGDADPTFTYQSSGYKFLDDESTVLTGSLTRDAGEHVANGPYAITQGTLASNADYSVEFVGGTLSITPASLTVTADNKTMAYGAAHLPPLTYSYDGLKLSDTSSVFTGALATTALVTSPFGTYPITQGTLDAGSDYTIAFTDGTLSVGAPSSISSIIQQSDAHPTAGRGPFTGILLAMSTMPRGALGGLAPAAGGNGGVMMTPAQLAEMAPAAGGNGPAAGGVVPLIECGIDTSCQINQ